MESPLICEGSCEFQLPMELFSLLPTCRSVGPSTSTQVTFTSYAGGFLRRKDLDQGAQNLIFPAQEDSSPPRILTFRKATVPKPSSLASLQAESSDLLRLEFCIGAGRAGGLGIPPLGMVLGNCLAVHGKPCSRVDIYMKIQISTSPKTLVSTGFRSIEKRDLDV